MNIFKSIVGLFKSTPKEEPIIESQVNIEPVIEKVEPPQKKIPAGELSLDEIQDVWHSFSQEERSKIISDNKNSSFYQPVVENDPVQFYSFLRNINYPTK
jgi:hypothetical protein